MSDHDWVQARLTDHVSGELTTDERRRVDAHLSVCPQCAAEARELAQTYASLALAAEPMAPPDALRRRVLAHLAALPQPVTEGQPPAARRRARRLWSPAGAAAAAILAFGWLALQSQQRAARLADALAEAQAEQRRLRLRMDEFGMQADLAVAILTAADLRTIELAGSDSGAGAQGRAYWSLREGLLIVADRLPPPPEGRTYQVWLLTAGMPVSAGLLIPDAAGRSTGVYPVPQGGVMPTGIALTEEPDGGLPQPTGQPILVGLLGRAG